jgi:hypothetical protein
MEIPAEYFFLSTVCYSMVSVTLWHPMFTIPVTHCDAQNAECQVYLMTT